MAVKRRVSETVDFDSLLVSLTNSGLQQKQPALYQTLKLFIDKASQQQKIIRQNIRQITGDIEVFDLPFDLVTIIENILKLLSASFITSEDETGDFVDSRQLIDGIGTTVNLSTAGRISIDTTGGGNDHVVMSDGSQPPIAMDDGNGNFLYVPYSI